MKRTRVLTAFAAVAAMLALAAPVAAHGDHDARLLAARVSAGPYVVSLWQVYPDAGDSMSPHVIVMFDGATVRPPEASVAVTVNGAPMHVVPSATTANGYESTHGVLEGDVVEVTIANGTGAWALAPVIVPAPPTSVLPMQELIYFSIFLTLGTAWWVFGRTARAWRKPAVSAI
jgi:hypothetical protein